MRDIYFLTISAEGVSQLKLGLGSSLPHVAVMCTTYRHTFSRAFKVPFIYIAVAVDGWLSSDVQR